ncbi:hypothetical protein RKD41_006215 [Streptomyces tendae]
MRADGALRCRRRRCGRDVPETGSHGGTGLRNGLPGAARPDPAPGTRALRRGPRHGGTGLPRRPRPHPERRRRGRTPAAGAGALRARPLPHDTGAGARPVRVSGGAGEPRPARRPYRPADRGDRPGRLGPARRGPRGLHDGRPRGRRDQRHPVPDRLGREPGPRPDRHGPARHPPLPPEPGLPGGRPLLRRGGRAALRRTRDRPPPGAGDPGVPGPPHGLRRRPERLQHHRERRRLRRSAPGAGHRAVERLRLLLRHRSRAHLSAPAPLGCPLGRDRLRGPAAGRQPALDVGQRPRGHHHGLRRVRGPAPVRAPLPPTCGARSPSRSGDWRRGRSR